MSETACYERVYPFQKLLDYDKTAFSHGHAEFVMRLQDKHMNRAGIPHGGVYSALLDSALGAAGVYKGSDNDFRVAVTLNLNVSFLAKPKGTVLTARGRLVGGGRTVYFSEGEITDEQNICVARATGTFRLLD